jgi:hypothetical protein
MNILAPLKENPPTGRSVALALVAVLFLILRNTTSIVARLNVVAIVVLGAILEASAFAAGLTVRAVAVLNAGLDALAQDAFLEDGAG